MQSVIPKMAAFAMLVVSSLKVSAFPIPDEPVVAVEPGLEMDDRLGNVLGWLDSRTLLVTAQIDSNSKFWERKVSVVDASTGHTNDLFHQGAVTCINPTEGLAGIRVGSDESTFNGNSKAPRPELRLYSWNASSGLLTLKPSTEGWNSWICKKTQPSDVDLPGISFTQTDSRYLEAKDGYLRFSPGQIGSDKKVVLVKNNKTIATLDAKPFEIAPVPQYMPFRNEYLLSAGRFVMGETMQRSNDAPTKEYPILTMDTSGKIEREYVRPLFESHGFTSDGQSFPYAKGTVILVGYRPHQNGGIYLSQGGSLKRIYCTNASNVPDRQCRATSVSVSPDGCHFAFFSVGSDNPKSPYVYRPTLKIIPLCN